MKLSFQVFAKRAEQCTPNVTSSTVPDTPTYYTESKLQRIHSSEEKVTWIIYALNSMKAHGHDDISISMLKTCAGAVSKPLNLIYERCLSEGIFPSIWKYANVQPVHKKENRQIKTNYRPISLLPVCGKILEKIILTNCILSLIKTI